MLDLSGKDFKAVTSRMLQQATTINHQILLKQVKKMKISAKKSVLKAIPEKHNYRKFLKVHLFRSVLQFDDRG